MFAHGPSLCQGLITYHSADRWTAPRLLNRFLARGLRRSSRSRSILLHYSAFTAHVWKRRRRWFRKRRHGKVLDSSSSSWTEFRFSFLLYALFCDSDVAFHAYVSSLMLQIHSWDEDDEYSRNQQWRIWRSWRLVVDLQWLQILLGSGNWRLKKDWGIVKMKIGVKARFRLCKIERRGSKMVAMRLAITKSFFLLSSFSLLFLCFVIFLLLWSMVRVRVRWRFREFVTMVERRKRIEVEETMGGKKRKNEEELNRGRNWMKRDELLL